MSAVQSELFSAYKRIADDKKCKRDAIMRALYPVDPQPEPNPDNYVGQIAGVLSRFTGTQQTVFDSGNSSGGGGGASANLLERQVQRAISQVMGRSASSPETFISALNDAFPVNSNGMIASSPSRSVISMFGGSATGSALNAAGLAGQISIEQANLYRQASIVVKDALLVLQGIQPFSPLVDLTQLETLRSLLASEIQTLLDEFGRVDEPRSDRVKAYFAALIGENADIRGGHLTEFGKVALLDRGFNPAVPATMADEAQIAAYELLQSYVLNLTGIWKRFEPEQDTSGSILFSERISRASIMLSVINEGNHNLMSAMDSIGFTENERRAKSSNLSILQEYTKPNGDPDLKLPKMTVNDLTDWLDRYANLEGPAIMSDSGLYGLQFVTEQADKLFWDVVSIVAYIKTADMSHVSNKPVLAQALMHERVSWTLEDVLSQLRSLADLAA